MTATTLKVINNHVGFRPGHGRKRILIPDIAEARTIFGDAVFWVYEQNRFSMESLNSPNQAEYVYRASMKRRRDDFGTWLEGDFSAVRGPGIYQAFCGATPGVNFAIRDDVWCRILPECLRYYQVQSCGRRVVGWHDACHLDDGYIQEEKRWIPAAGGWHDAGDFRKWVTSTSLMAISLLVAHRLWKGREENLGLEPGIFLREALQGVHFFLGVQHPEHGYLYHNIGGGKRTVHDNEDNRYTDNVRESGDERRIHPGPAKPPAKCTALFALYADALRETDPALATRCYQAALLSDRFDSTAPDLSADAVQWRAWAHLELWRFAHKEEHRIAALQQLEQLLQLQVTEYVGGQKLVRGFFRAGPHQAGYHHKHIGADYPIWVIAEFLAEWPALPEATRWRNAIALWADEYAAVFVERNPFGLLPYAFYDAPSPEHPHCLYRPIGESLYYRYFNADSTFGINARSALSAAALAAAARVLDRPALLDHGYRLLEWIVGANPFQISTVNGVGVLQPCALSFQMGNIPGGVTMGVYGDEADRPAYPANAWLGCDEYYGYQTSQFLWALLALQDGSW